MRLRKRGLTAALLALWLWLPVVGSAQEALLVGTSLGTPPVFPDRAEPLILQGPSLLAVSGLSVNPSEREASRAFYFGYYENASKPPITWTGDVSTCNAGDTASAFKDAVMLRINYFRAMAGVPAAVAWSPTYSAKAQAAALIMAANGSLSHDPPASWKCYAAEGDEAAGNSNLSLGRYGWDAISGYMEDWGPNNGYVGHRRWVLYPQTQTMGTGDIPPGSSWPANALWVFDANMWSARPATREPYVAWPPPGYVPYQVVFPRWSFAYAGADFAQASVTVTQGGQSVPVTKEPYGTGYGENTLVWVMNNMSSGDNWPNPGADKPYQVTLQNVKINGSSSNFTYTVTVFDPGQQTCQYTVAPLQATFQWDGGTGNVNVTAPSGCAWTVAASQTWIHVISGGSGSGNGVVGYKVDLNPSVAARSGSLTVAGKTVLITQDPRPSVPLGWLPLLLDDDR